jgi:uncharacterized protein (DUF433 family)
MGLRVIYWLRQKKTTSQGVEIPRTSMPTIRRALRELRALDLSIWDRNEPTVLVDVSGSLHLQHDEHVHTLAGQVVNNDIVDLIAPFATREGTQGPDLARPRPELRILPGKLSGSPHVVHTRLETRALAALRRDGFELSAIHKLYPYVSEHQISEALDLEKQLDANLLKRAA